MRGFSLIEAMLVMALTLVAGGVAMIQMRSTMLILDADKACNLVSSQLRYARQIAVDQRRNVLVEFLGTNEIKITRQNGGGATTVMADVFLPTGFIFAKPTGSGDTPDNYGAAAVVYFNGATSGTFLADGIFVTNASSIVMNGSVFTMGANNASARAVTLTGASGRIKIYGRSGSSWVERT